MEIEFEKGFLDVHGDARLTIERTNPLLNDVGSVSLTYPIVRSVGNDVLLGYPQLIERGDAFGVKYDVNVRCGLFNENATLQLTSCDGEKVEGVFLLYESSLYSEIKDMELKSVFEGVERWFDERSVPRERRVRNIVELCERILLGRSVEHDDVFTVVPVMREVEYSDVAVGWGSELRYWAKGEYSINGLEWGDDGSCRMRGREEYRYRDANDREITLPVGFGVSVMLRFGYVLHRIFEYFGFTLSEGLFTGDGLYRSLTVVNNTQDAVVLGYLKEKQLVPDCSVSEFLNVVREAFNADFFVDVAAKSVRLVTFNEVLSEPADVDLSEWVVSVPVVEYSEREQVKLDVGRDLPYSEAAAETYGGLLNRYGAAGYELASNPRLLPEWNSVVRADYVGVDVSDLALSGVSVGDVVEYRAERLGSLNFGYWYHRNIACETHELPFTVPAVLYNERDRRRAVVLGEYRVVNSRLVVSGGNSNEGSSGELPIVLCLQQQGAEGVVPSACTYFNYPATELGANIGQLMPPVVRDGVAASLYTWGDDGLFARWWKVYDGCLRDSWHTVTVKCRMPVSVLQEFRFDRMKLLNGQPMVVDKLSYVLTDEAEVDVTLVMRTTKGYGR